MHHDFWNNDILGPDERNLRLLVDGICRLAGVEPLPGLDDLRTIEDQEIVLAGGDGNDAEEAPQPWSPEDWAASYRNLIDHCTAKISEIEAQIAPGAAS
jgi:hypothetical protein